MKNCKGGIQCVFINPNSTEDTLRVIRAIILEKLFRRIRADLNDNVPPET